MSFLEIAKKRYSVRNYKPNKVEKDKLEKILEAGWVAPSGSDNQPYKLIVVQEDEGLDKIRKAADFYSAPLAIIVCGDHEKSWKRPFDGKSIVEIDASIITDHMMLQATELGLGSVWICYFKPDVIMEEFNLPDHLEPLSILAIGYADGNVLSPDRHAKTRIPQDEIVSYEKL